MHVTLPILAAKVLMAPMSRAMGKTTVVTNTYISLHPPRARRPTALAALSRAARSIRRRPIRSGATTGRHEVQFGVQWMVNDLAQQ